MKKKLEIKKHVLIPKHSKLSQKEREELFKRYSITFKDLPKIFKDDPALQALDVKPGDIIKIERDSATAGKAIFYRGIPNE